MARYRKKPVVVEAEQYRIGLEDGFCTMGEAIVQGISYEGFRQPECAAFRGVPFIKTLEGRHFISEGDFIITGVEGERYPCKPGIFEQTYEPAEKRTSVDERVRRLARQVLNGWQIDDGNVAHVVRTDAEQDIAATIGKALEEVKSELKEEPETQLAVMLEQIVEMSSALCGVKLGGPTEAERLKRIYDTALEALGKYRGIGQENNS